MSDADVGSSSPRLALADAINATCPWSGKEVAADSLTLYNGAVVGFCNTGCRDRFAAAVAHFEAGLQERRVAAATVE